MRAFAEVMKNMARMKACVRPAMCKPYGKQSEALQKSNALFYKLFFVFPFFHVNLLYCEILHLFSLKVVYKDFHVAYFQLQHWSIQYSLCNR